MHYPFLQGRVELAKSSMVKLCIILGEEEFMDLVKRSDLARMGKVRASLITKNCLATGVWAEAVDEETGYVNVDHILIQEWLGKREDVKSAEEMSLKDWEHLTLKTIIREYSSIPKFQDLARTYKILAETEHKKIQIEASRNQLVSRENIGKVCFGYLETMNRRLLEMPAGQIPKIMAIVDSGADDIREQISEKLVKEFSKIIKGVKHDLIKRLGDDFADAD